MVDAFGVGLGSFLSIPHPLHPISREHVSTPANNLFALPIDKEVDMKKAAKVVGEKSLSMVHVKDINKVTGYIRGGCTPIGMKKQYPTVIHESAKNFDQIIVSGGRLGAQIFLAPDDLVKVTKGQYADIINSTPVTSDQQGKCQYTC